MVIRIEKRGQSTVLPSQTTELGGHQNVLSQKPLAGKNARTIPLTPNRTEVENAGDMLPNRGVLPPPRRVAQSWGNWWGDADLSQVSGQAELAMREAYTPEGKRGDVRTAIGKAASFLAVGAGSGGKIEVVAGGPQVAHGPMSIFVQRTLGDRVVSRIEMSKEGEIAKDVRGNPYYTKYTYNRGVEEWNRFPYKP